MDFNQERDRVLILFVFLIGAALFCVIDPLYLFSPNPDDLSMSDEKTSITEDTVTPPPTPKIGSCYQGKFSEEKKCVDGGKSWENDDAYDLIRIVIDEGKKNFLVRTISIDCSEIVQDLGEDVITKESAPDILAREVKCPDITFQDKHSP